MQKSIDMADVIIEYHSSGSGSWKVRGGKSPNHKWIELVSLQSVFVNQTRRGCLRLFRYITQIFALIYDMKYAVRNAEDVPKAIKSPNIWTEIRIEPMAHPCHPRSWWREVKIEAESVTLSGASRHFGGKDPTNNAMKEGNAHGCLFGQREPEKSKKKKEGKRPCEENISMIKMFGAKKNVCK